MRYAGEDGDSDSLSPVRREKQAGESLVTVSKLTNKDDIEGYLTTFERQMATYEVNNTRWAFLLAPNYQEEHHRPTW